MDSFLLWKVQDWRKKGANTSPEMSRMRTEGLSAYAERQAAFFDGLRLSFKALWKDVPAHILRMQAVIKDPTLLKPGELDNKKTRAQSK